jgi:hypothetical protein
MNDFISGKQKLPLKITLGSNYQIPLFQKRDCLILALDLIQSIDSYFQANVGLEYWFYHLFALRAGYKLGNNLKGALAFGGGIKWGKTFPLHIDYAFVNYQNLTPTHCFSLSVGF